MTERILTILFSLFIGVILLLVAVGISSAIMSATNHRYWINTPNQTYYTNSYEEKDGCLEFIDYYDHKVKQCGVYSISDKGEQ